jgi:hypothetical protein
MSAVAKALPDDDPETGQPIWLLTLKCGHTVTCGRHGATPPTSRPGDCRKCKLRAKEQRKWIKRKARRAAQREAAQAQPSEAERVLENKIRVLMAAE